MKNGKKQEKNLTKNIAKMDNNQQKKGLEITNPVLIEIKKEVDLWASKGNYKEKDVQFYTIGFMAQKIIHLDESLKRQVQK